MSVLAGFLAGLGMCCMSSSLLFSLLIMMRNSHGFFEKKKKKEVRERRGLRVPEEKGWVAWLAGCTPLNA